MNDEMPFYETVIANSKVSQKQDISSDLQDKINPVHPVNPVRKIDGWTITSCLTKETHMKSDLPDFYESNLSLLEKHYPDIYKIMTESPPDPMGEIFLSPDGKPNLKVVNKEGKVINLHVATDPEAEVPQFLKMVPENSTGFVALLGMGLGYTPLALLQQRAYIRHLAVFEQEPGIFRQALQCMDLSSMLSDPRLMLSVSRDPEVPKVLAPANRALQLEAIHTLSHLPSFSFDNAAYQELSDKVFACVNSFNVGGATILGHGNLFIANRFRHLSAIHHNYLLESLKGAFSEIPAIIVAGGPSLDKNIHLLPMAKNKAVIIAADTVLPPLLAHGVSPDFVTSIDYQDLTYEKFANVAPIAKGVGLICASWVTPKVPKVFPAENVFWTFSAKPIEKWLNALLGGNILTGGAGTVAHLNLTAAIIMGCSPIIFVGQDLAFTGNKDHAENIVLTSKTHLEKQLKQKKDIVWIEGIDGGKVPTNRAFFSDKKHFEGVMANHPGHYINATEGGAHIEGTEVLCLKEVLDSYCSKIHDISDRISSCLEVSKLSDTKKLLSEFRTTLREIKTLQKTIKKVDRLIHAVSKGLSRRKKDGAKYRSFSALPKPLQQKVREIDAFHKRLDSATKIWQILEEVTMDGLRQSERMMHEIGKLESNPEKYMEWLAKNLERLDSINTVRTNVLATIEEHLSKTLDHHEKENRFLKAIEKEDKENQNLLELARLYFESGNLVLAQPVIEKLLSITQDSAEVHFYLGSIAAHQTDYEKADKYFQRAEQLDPAFSKRIEDLRQQLGDQYFGYANKYRRTMDSNTFKRMLLKGLRYCRDHTDIKKELEVLTVEELKEINSGLESDTPAKHEDANALIRAWHKDLEENKNLSSFLSVEQVAEFYRYHGNLLVSENDFAGAVESFSKALAFSPNNPDLHIFIMDALFSQEEFTHGINHLKKAVELDRAYAQYWENMGDNLQKAGQIDDAVSAYEQCFMALPENIALLKKMGDCYLAMGQMEAAHEAYRQLKGKLEEVGDRPSRKESGERIVSAAD